MPQDTKQFHIDVKGLIFNEESKVMLLEEPSGKYDLPGGRLEHGETFSEALKREFLEEMGVACDVIDKNPRFSWTAYWEKENTHLVYLCFKIELSSFNFIDSNECVGYNFFSPEELDNINITKAITPLKEWLLGSDSSKNT